MPVLSDNIPAYVFYGCILSEFLRIAKCTLKFSLFRKRNMNEDQANQVSLLEQTKKSNETKSHCF